MSYCEECGYEMSPTAKYCKECGHSQDGIKRTSKTIAIHENTENQKMPLLPISGGILIMLASVVSLALIFYFLYILDMMDERDFMESTFPQIGIIFSLFGIPAGIIALSRRGLPFVVFLSTACMIGTVISIYYNFLFGLLAIILCVLGIVFVALGRKDFKKTFYFPEKVCPECKENIDDCICENDI